MKKNDIEGLETLESSQLVFFASRTFNVSEYEICMSAVRSLGLNEKQGENIFQVYFNFDIVHPLVEKHVIDILKGLTPYLSETDAILLI
jgi:hypothetical protein